MTTTQVKVMVIGLVIMAGFGAALFGGFVPGLKPSYNSPDVDVLNGTSYFVTAVQLTAPFFPLNHTSPQLFPFRNVTFALSVSNWYSYPGGLVRGNGTEANSTAYPFVLGISSNPPVDTTLFISPDGEFAASWPGGFVGGLWVHLFVRE